MLGISWLAEKLLAPQERFISIQWVSAFHTKHNFYYIFFYVFHPAVYKGAGSIPDGIIGIFHPSGRTMALGLTQALTEMSTRIVPSGVKAAGA